MIILSFDYSFKLLSLSLSDSNFIFYSEIFGNFVSSKYILLFIKSILIKNNITYSDIDAILVNENKNAFTYTKIFFAVIQSLSLTHNIPIFKINTLNAITKELIFLKEKRYFLITSELTTNKYLFNIYLKYKKSLIIISENKNLNFEQLINNADCFIIYTQMLQHTKIFKNSTFFVSKAIYLDLFFRKYISLSTYILPNSTSILYCENNYILQLNEQHNTN